MSVIPHIHILTTGGTIEFQDSAYNRINTELLDIDSTIETYLDHLIKPHFTFSCQMICSKDSRDITEADRHDLLNAIRKVEQAHVLVTHGTYTMVETAKFLNDQGCGERTVILTGSMVPLAGFAKSDAGFNLGFAVASFQHLDPGVWIAMNGGVFQSDDVEKNADKFRFE